MSARWFNALGEEVNLDEIDSEYALNILTMYVARKARQGWEDTDFRGDELMQKLRNTVLTGRQRDGSDSLRAAAYNKRCAARGLRFRASQ